jgi:hypothetical protein
MISSFPALALATALLPALPAQTETPAPPADAVLVLGALYGLHVREESFGYDRLRDALEAFRPDVVIIEVRPDELAGRTGTPGRPEYPEVIWPWLRNAGAEPVAMEPGGLRFEALTGEASAAFAALARNDPKGATALASFDDAIEAALLEYWRHPAQTQDETTARMVDSHSALRAAIVGPAFAKVQAAWDDEMAQVVIRTVGTRPGKRVLVIGSYRNRVQLENAVRKAAPARMIPAAEWLVSVEARSANAPSARKM